MRGDQIHYFLIHFKLINVQIKSISFFFSWKPSWICVYVKVYNLTENGWTLFAVHWTIWIVFWHFYYFVSTLFTHHTILFFSSNVLCRICWVINSKCQTRTSGSYLEKLDHMLPERTILIDFLFCFLWADLLKNFTAPTF